MHEFCIKKFNPYINSYYWSIFLNIEFEKKYETKNLHIAEFSQNNNYILKYDYNEKVNINVRTLIHNKYKNVDIVDHIENENYNNLDKDIINTFLYLFPETTANAENIKRTKQQ